MTGLDVLDRCRRAGIGEAVLQRLWPEQGKQRHRDGAELVGRDMRDRGLRRLRQQHGHAIAARDPQLSQQIGKAVRPVPQFAVAIVAGPIVGAGKRQGDPLRLPCRPAVAHIDADVVALWTTPAKIAGKRGIAVGCGQHRRSLTGRRLARNL